MLQSFNLIIRTNIYKNKNKNKQRTNVNKLKVNKLTEAESDGFTAMSISDV